MPKRTPFMHPDAVRQFEANLLAADVDTVEDAVADLEDLGDFLDDPISFKELTKHIPESLRRQIAARSSEVVRQQRELASSIARLTVIANRVYLRKEKDADRAEAKRRAALPRCDTCGQTVDLSKGKR